MKYSASCEKSRILIWQDIFSSIKEFFSFAVPSAIMICFTTITLHNFIPYGISAAASTRVSNELGAGNPEAAQLAVVALVALTAVEAILSSTALFCSRYIFGYAFSSEEKIVDYVTEMAPFISLSIIADSLHAAFAGVARGSGWQHIAAYVNLGAYYLVGIPVGVVLCFVLRLRGKGLWIGIVTGSAVQALALAFVTALTNWKKQAINVQKRIFEGTISADSG